MDGLLNYLFGYFKIGKHLLISFCLLFVAKHVIW